MRPFGWWLLIGALVLLTLTCLLPLVLDFLFALAFGWVFYLARVLPSVTVSPDGLATAAVCLVLFTAGAHRFASWLHGEIRGPGAPPWRRWWTGAVVAGLVLMFTAGMAATGVVHQLGWVLSSPVPVVGGGGASMAARRAQSTNNLKQTWIAADGFRNEHHTFPPGMTVGDYGVLLHGWQALVVGYDEFPPGREIDFRKPWDDPVNRPVFEQPVQHYLNPAVDAVRDASGLALSHYEGNVHLLGGPRRFRVEDVTDGTSQTIFAGEVADGFHPWGQPRPGRDPADGINRAPGLGFGSPFPGGANVLMADGSVQFFRNSIDPSLLKDLSTPAGGEKIAPDRY